MLGGKKIKPPKMQDELLSTEQKPQKPVQDIKVMHMKHEKYLNNQLNIMLISTNAVTTSR